MEDLLEERNIEQRYAHGEGNHYRANEPLVTEEADLEDGEPVGTEVKRLE